MPKHPNLIIADRMLALIQRIDARLSPEIIEDNRDLVVNGEWGVALENLCQQLFEFDVVVEADLLEEIKSLTKEMKLAPETWNFLLRAQ
jgi:hypothetical protein